MKYIIPSTRLILLACAIIAALPPLAKVCLPADLGISKLWHKQPTFPPVWPEKGRAGALVLPEDVRIEVPRRDLIRVSRPVFWAELANVPNLERNIVARGKNREPMHVLGQHGDVVQLAAGKNPFGHGLTMLVKPSSKISPSEPNPWTVILYSVLPEETCFDSVQAFADGKFTGNLDLMFAVPFRIDPAKKIIYAVWGSNAPGIGEAFDWAQESLKKRTELAAKIRTAKDKGPEADAAVAAEIKKARADGYDLDN